MKPIVFELIMLHQNVYESAGMKPPPYRITCKEHKELVTYIKEAFPVNKDKCSTIAELYGVQLEVVMIVEPYL